MSVFLQALEVFATAVILVVFIGALGWFIKYYWGS